MADSNTIKDRVAIVGIGESAYYKRGQSPYGEFHLMLQAILAAAEDAGIDPKEIDGFASYAGDRNEPMRIATALGTPKVGFSNMHWGGGGGGGSGAVGNAAAAIVAGYSKYVVAYRGLAQGQFGRFGQALAARSPKVTGGNAYQAPFGCMSAGQTLAAMQAQRHMHEFGTQQEHFGAVALASYKHAQTNPRAVMYGRPLTMEDYHASRWVAQPLHLFDCCQETDGAAAVILTTAERARDMKQVPAYMLAAAQGSGFRYGAGAMNRTMVHSNHEALAESLWGMAGIGPKDVDVAQFYENFTPLVLMSIEDYGFCEKGEGGPFVAGGRVEWPGGDLPINTSGGNLAEAYTHGFEIITEAVRQVRGTSTAQVEDAEISFVASGPGVSPLSSLILRR